MAEINALPIPFEALGMPAELDGSVGANRVKGGYKQIAADTDADALKAFLARYGVFLFFVQFVTVLEEKIF